MKDNEGSAKDHVCNPWTDQCGDGQREREGHGLVEVGTAVSVAVSPLHRRHGKGRVSEETAGFPVRELRPETSRLCGWH